MTVRIITVMCWAIILTMWMPEGWFSGCTIDDCYWYTCPHVQEKFGAYWWYPFARESTDAVIDLFKLMGEYQSANAIVYLGFVPGLAVVNGWLHRLSAVDFTSMILSVFAMFMIGSLSAPVGSMPSGSWFWYCTEWCMRLANATGLTYGGVCFLIFVVGIPVVLLGDLILGLVNRLRTVTDLEPAVESFARS